MQGRSLNFVPSRRLSRSGNMLAMVVAILFILVVLVLGLHTSQTKAVRNVTQAEGELQFRQGFEFEVARLLANTEPIPEWVDVTGVSESVSNTEPEKDYAKTLFTELPSLNPKDKDFPQGFQTYRVTPTTSDDALKVFAGRYEWLVAQTSAGYAAYAPNGEISLASAMGWANPTLDDERDSVDAYNGVPVLLAAKTALKVDELTYGMAYLQEGDLEIGGIGAIGFQGRPPLRAYETKLKEDLEALRSEMAAAASTGDKTAQIKGDALETAGTIVTMIFGGSGEPSLSLQQAIQVPFPMIPGFSATVPGVFYEFWFHMPYPPDFASFDAPDGRDAMADAKEAQRLDEEIKKVKAEIAALQAKKNATSDQDEKDDIQDQINAKQDKLDQLEQDAQDLQDALEDSADKNKDAVGNKVGSSPPDEPITRFEDKDIPKTGIKGWAYAAIFENFFNLLKNTMTGNFEEIAESFVNFVRVIHFGKKNFEPEFRFDDGFFAKATFNVPTGRTFRYQGNCEFEGDLWLQKGSVMHVGGNLTLSNPNTGSNNPFRASGKLVMEEGSTLVVDGNLTLAGNSKYGSLWVCSQAGTLTPISTAILAGGSVDIPHGSFTSTSLEDAAKWIVSKEGGLDGVQDVMKVLFTDVAPNLSKIAGPFHTRQPFFASYAATFQLTIVPTPVGPIPIPTPIPLPRKNVLIPIFRGFTYVYTPAMNVALGENLYTHADWWGFGEGTVPVLPKIDPIRMAKALTGVNLGGLNLDNIKWDVQVETLMKEVVEGAMQFVMQEIVKAVMAELAKAAIPGGGFVGFALDAILAEIGAKDDFFQDIQDAIIQATLGPVINELERWVDELQNQVEDGLSEGYLREVNGPLIYANTISVGESSSPRLMVGMLVAKSSINIEARTFVGSLLCLEGDITAQDLLFTPHFTRASLYKPTPTDSNWLLRATDWKYGDRMDSKAATGISTGVNMVRTEGWSR